MLSVQFIFYRLWFYVASHADVLRGSSRVPAPRGLWAILKEFEFAVDSNSFKIVQKTAFEAKGRLYTTGKVIQRLFITDLYT